MLGGLSMLHRTFVSSNYAIFSVFRNVAKKKKKFRKKLFSIFIKGEGHLYKKEDDSNNSEQTGCADIYLLNMHQMVQTAVFTPSLMVIIRAIDHIRTRCR